MQKLIYAIAALLIGATLVGFLLPRAHQVEVQIEIDAHPATVFALLNDFRRVVEWSPWVETDPNARFEFSGSERGEGAVMTWEGGIVGSGTQRIDTSRAYEHIGITVNPGEASAARAWFDLGPGVGTTIVTQGLEVDYGFNILGRYFASVFGGVVTREYQGGLSRLKDLAESLPSADFADLKIEAMTVEATDIAYLTTSSSPQPAAMAQAMSTAYFQVLRFMDEHELEETGPPLAILRGYSGALQVIDAAIPINSGAELGTGSQSVVKIGQSYSGSALRISHVGSYAQLRETHRKITAYLAALGIERNGSAWESYVTDPGKVTENELLTYIFYPIR